MTGERVVLLDEELPAMQPLPPTTGWGDAAVKAVRDEKLYVSDDPYPASRAQIVDRGYLRALEIVTVEVAPVQYLPRSRSLVVAEGLKVVLDFEGTAPFVRKPLEESQLFMYRSVVSNIDMVEAEAGRLEPEQGAVSAPDAGADILIIAYDAFIPELASLVTWRASQGYIVEVVGISTIYEPDDDTDDERIEALRDYLKGVMDPETGWDPAPGFVLLVGDKAEITPAYFTGTYGDVGWSDHHFSCVIGDDWYSDLAIGRFSASSASDVTNQVNKTLFYEQSPQAHTGVVGASGETGGDFENCEDCKAELLMEPANVFAQTNYNGSDGSDYNTFVHAFNGTVCPTTGKNFGPGTGVITVDTHGNSSVWGGLLSISSCTDAIMTNREYFPIAFISACMCGKFEVEDCIMEKLNQIQGGTVANTGSSTLACGGTSDQLLNIALQGLTGVDPPYHPDRFEYTISPDIGYVPIVGHAMMAAKNEYLAYHGNPDGWNVKENMMQYNLFGDPALTTAFTSPLAVSSAGPDGSAVSLEWTPIYPKYTVEYKDYLGLPWGPVPGTEWPISENSWTGDDTTGKKKRFYRVEGLPAEGFIIED
jgi:hypothetical protein